MSRVMSRKKRKSVTIGEEMLTLVCEHCLREGKCKGPFFVGKK